MLASQAAMEVFRMADMGGRVFAASAGSAPTVVPCCPLHQHVLGHGKLCSTNSCKPRGAEGG